MHARPARVRHRCCLAELRPNSRLPLRLASLGYALLKHAGVTTVARRLRSGGLVLCYHNIVPGTASSCGVWGRLGLHMPVAAFARQMRWLADTHDVIPLERLVDRLAARESLRGTAAVTFDDAYGGVFEHAWPLLQALHIPATVFVVADAPDTGADYWWDHPAVLRAYSPEAERRWLSDLHGDRAAIVKSVSPNGKGGAEGASRPPEFCRPATWRTIAGAARSGLHLGAHSATHRVLATLDAAELEREVSGSRAEIARHTGVTPACFAYPYGHWSEPVRQAVRAAGYRAAFSLDRTRKRGAVDLWTIPRLNVPATIGDAAFEAWTAGLRP